MTKNQKILTGVGVAVLVYWVWSRNKAGKSLNPFAKSSSFDGDDDFFNFSLRGIKRKSKKASPFGKGGLLFGSRNNWVASKYDANDNSTWMAHIDNPSGYWVSGQFPVGATSGKYGEQPQ